MSKIGVCEWYLPVNGPFALDFAADCGFDGIQLGDLGGSRMGYPMTNERIRQGYLEAAQRTGVVLQSMHLYTLVRDAGHIFPMDSPEGEAGCKSIRLGIDSCEAMHIPCLNISAFFQSGVNNDYDWCNLVEHLKFACEYGKDHGVYVAYEPGVKIEKVKGLLSEVPDLKINYDLTNPRSLGLGEPLEEIVTLGAEVIDHVHVKDSLRDSWGKYLGSCFAGEGTGKIKEAIALLKRLGYDNWYLSESNYLSPRSYGVGPDLSVVCREDCRRIRAIVDAE